MAEKDGARVWSLPGAPAAVRLEKEAVFLKAGSSSFLAVDSKGITLRGNVSFASMGPGQRTGGVFVLLPEFANMIPKTIVTPIPMMIPFPPLGIVASIAAGVTIATAFLAG